MSSIVDRRLPSSSHQGDYPCGQAPRWILVRSSSAILGSSMFPNPYTNHSVASSDWKGGKGDVVGEFVKAMRKEGMRPAFYLSPWDRNYYNMTWDPTYNDFYAKTLEHLLSHYGPVYEVCLFVPLPAVDVVGRRQCPAQHD